MIDEEKLTEIQKKFGQKLQIEGIKALKDSSFLLANEELALYAVEVGIKLEELARARDRPRG